ncbi:MAG TPA: HEAT repeat domain-containing protein, partial [Blastocatellia bacterium]|nr:HEAT repeat domain-containing protein [Blastocatellia bacterium]
PLYRAATGPEEELVCMLSHKCSNENHRLAGLIGAALAPHGVRLLIDGLRAGAEFNTGTQTLDFDGFLLLFTDDAWASAQCQLEIQSACRRRMPMFTAYVSGTLPDELTTTITIWRPHFTDPGELRKDAEVLVRDMRTRVVLTRHLRSLTSENPPDVTREAAKALTDSEARNVVAEFAQDLAQGFSRVHDATTRFWIAQALGNAGTPEAAKALRTLPSPDDPLVSKGIREALLMIEGGDVNRKESNP